MLSKTLLPHLANPSSYSRGEDYFHGVDSPDLNLYLNALENRCRTAGVLADYLKLREFWTPARRREFADSLTPTPAFGSMSNPLFYAQVLHTEERGSDLLAWLKTLSRTGEPWQFMRSMPTS